MNASKIAKLADKYRQAIGDAVANGDPIPAVEAVFPLDVQKQLRKRYPHQVGDLLDDLTERAEGAQEAIEALDSTVDMLELLGGLLRQAEILVELQAEANDSDEPQPLVPETVTPSEMKRTTPRSTSPPISRSSHAQRTGRVQHLDDREPGECRRHSHG